MTNIISYRKTAGYKVSLFALAQLFSFNHGLGKVRRQFIPEWGNYQRCIKVFGITFSLMRKGCAQTKCINFKRTIIIFSKDVS
ncbi:MAG: hypothetical protein BZ151_11980 [Desulfobacca sp. 4484_104]|nr:MAG: hypothetical protein BZ151_11980 [Desulfobacca sp. 4484_104]